MISTYWGGIPEIVDDHNDGILIPVRDLDALKQAMLQITEDNYCTMAKNAQKSFSLHFDSNSVNSRVINDILSLWDF